MNLIVSHYKSSLPQRLLLLLVLVASAQLAIGQQTQSQSPTETPVHATDAQAQQQEVANISAPALMTLRYWWFLSYQHHLDVVAAQFEASGKDASNLRNALQKQLRFSDADYEPVRASSERLAAEVQSLYTEVKSDPSQMAGLSEARGQYVNEEMNTLADSLSPQNKAALDAFVVRLFPIRQPNRKAVQQ